MFRPLPLFFFNAAPAAFIAVLAAFLAASAATPLAALAPMAPAQADATKPVYHAVKKGTKWVYETSNGEEPTLVVTGVEFRGGAQVVSLGRVQADGQTAPGSRMVVSAWGLFTEGAADDPAYCLLKLPHDVGQTWALDPGDGHGLTFTASGPERVKVPAGEFEAIRVVLSNRHPRDRTAEVCTTMWFARGIGLVKRTMPGWHQVLKSFTPAKG